ncbi:Cytoplasmic tRNA 2-thiolation protein [Spironucleus salmonicida]|uniref:Cytoplasmic tRNA 2-thiolation protein n=1 Tax=Spironucleus salmonicida TaxID=348837 RepID=V6LE47_9EUKA|nr:Cytoplasmic tRNA 2-thiolation protein [Spironucleus salmonicida]|eukprot:EST42553.1 Cytoplasmic tRNA 2-thiolation protein [Spironucleus salmonicida]
MSLIKKCSMCQAPPVVRHSFTKIFFCATCFQINFLNEVHEYVQNYNLIPINSSIVVGVSGGKDSSVLLDVLFKLINTYPDIYVNTTLHMVAVDEGIKNYRDNSLDVVREIQAIYNLPLKIVSFEAYYKRSLDDLIVMLDSTNSSCSFCGILRRSSLQKGANELNLPNMRVATGHNADDNAETVMLNLLRGDSAKLLRCVDPVASLEANGARIKPLAFQAQKDIVLYAFHAKLKYFSTECPYAVTAFRGVARRLIQELSRSNSMCQIQTQEAILSVRGERPTVKVQSCAQCGTAIVGSKCQACEIANSNNAEELRRVLKVK